MITLSAALFRKCFPELDRIRQTAIKLNLSSFWPLLQSEEIESGLDLCTLQLNESSSHLVPK